MPLRFCQYFVCEEFCNRFGGYGMEGIVDRYAYALLTLTHAEGAAKLDLLTQIVFGNQVLKLLNNLTRTLNVAGASDTYCNFKHNILPFFILDFDLGGAVSKGLMRGIPASIVE